MRLLPILTLGALVICQQPVYAQQDMQKKIQRQLIMAEDGSVIELPAGQFQLSSTLSLEGKKKILIKGAGMDKTILSFKGQTEGAEGLRVSNAEDITIRDLTVQDTKGDGIKTMQVKGIAFKQVKVEWTGPPVKENGAYGLYPVQCRQVLIDSCIAIGASDAGLYVGQSSDIVVRNCIAKNNVAGIEIENSLHAEVYQNEALENTGGILVFDLPDLVQKKGGYVKVYNNNIHHNNFPNFAPKGNTVAKVPAGTGVMVLATSHVEVYNNKIHYNNSAGTAIISYFMTENPINDSLYDPYPSNVYVHDNDYLRDRVRFQGKGRMGMMFRFKLRFGKNVPHIIYDGILNQEWTDGNGRYKPEYRICISDNNNASFANLDAGNKFKNVSRNMDLYDCSNPVATTVSY
ncbi:parallel beta-helix domain-containing protein [Chitinophaga japonensis]|uniref:Parallel beta-helix repeat protein n=1 Tax=Chitinophaga japonensis TaxID=104662 RepID=A0A562T471_CHIJA|nr:parallel beta-helix domain-containing protein [Chitinophaga japonensis]TWI88341.1 parallel beta-helix repeat protein [Chitinophaga japonensis]